MYEHKFITVLYRRKTLLESARFNITRIQFAVDQVGVRASDISLSTCYEFIVRADDVIQCSLQRRKGVICYRRNIQLVNYTSQA